MSNSANILICGDLVWDTHIARVSLAGQRIYDPHPNTQLENAHGGAWYLGDMISSYLSSARAWTAVQPTGATSSVHIQDTKVFGPELTKHEEIESKLCPGGVACSFSIWEWYRSPKNDDPTGVWRIGEFLGCKVRATTLDYPRIAKEPDTAELIVIEDLGLGFSDNRAWWPKALKAASNNKPSCQILIKGTPRFKSELWQYLTKEGLLENTTLVTSTSGLRAIGGDLSRGMSWDRIVDNLRNQFASTDIGRALQACRRVVITIGLEGAAVFSRLPQTAAEYAQDDFIAARLRFERVVFDRDHLEGQWTAKHPGITYGRGTAITAAMAAHILMTPQPSTHFTLARALELGRKLHIRAGGTDKKHLSIRGSNASSAAQCATDADLINEVWVNRIPDTYMSAYPRELITDPEVGSLPDASSLLVTDRFGNGGPYLLQAAQDIVRLGKETALAGVPSLSIGKYFTVDKDEIENINTVRNLIEEYRNSPEKRPLSIAVFGQPGSGKSFAIKELSAALFSGKSNPLEFNLSQFQTVEDLHEALQEVRDRCIDGEIPLVFWDEFDTKRAGEPLGWLKEFLAPMQDHAFVTRGKSHSLGKCIFIFAGGTKQTFQAFDETSNARKAAPNANGEINHPFIAAKGPDFVSRLRGYLNIKGPNPISLTDSLYVVRRALQIRSQIEKYHQSAINPITKRINVDYRVLNALLQVSEYIHGSRSIEAIISLSHIREDSHFGPSELPPLELLNLHTNGGFAELLDNSNPSIEPEDVEILAAMIHRKWLAETSSEEQRKLDTGRDDYARLPEEYKEQNRAPARLALQRLYGAGCTVERFSDEAAKKNVIAHAALEQAFILSEHARWMREQLMKGYAYGKVRDKKLLLHPALVPMSDLDPDMVKLDKAVIEALFEYLTNNALAVELQVTVSEPGTASVPGIGTEPEPPNVPV